MTKTQTVPAVTRTTQHRRAMARSTWSSTLGHATKIALRIVAPQYSPDEAYLLILIVQVLFAFDRAQAITDDELIEGRRDTSHNAKSNVFIFPPLAWDKRRIRRARNNLCAGGYLDVTQRGGDRTLYYAPGTKLIGLMKQGRFAFVRPEDDTPLGLGEDDHLHVVEDVH